MALGNYLRQHTNPPVFILSAVLVFAFVLWGVVAPANLGAVSDAVMAWITTYFGWWYVLSVSGFLVFVLFLLLSPYARVRLGKDDDRPEWSTWAWFSMLFTAGMGIGLVFYGVAEPIFHMTDPPVGQGGSTDAALDAMNLTFFHWGLHPWAVYIVLGMALGYFCFRYDMPLRPASAFYPLIGERVHGPLGDTIDILAVFGTLFGLATSLGLGASQISAGMASVFGVPDNAVTQVLIIVVVTAVAVASVLAGLDAGIRRLSVLNMWLAVTLAAVVFIAGPTLFILEFMVGSTGNYIQNLPGTSLRMFSFSETAAEWMSSWTLFYWGWWISWSPFVGIFLARISKGRTIRQVILGTLLAPTAASIVWFSTFGGTALNFILERGSQALANAGTTDAMFLLLNELPLAAGFSSLLSLLAIIVVAIFFATSSDSGSLVVDMLTNGGDPRPQWQQRLFWAVTEGLVAAVLLVAGAVVGGDPLSALQTAAVTSGLPFSIVLVFICWGLIRQLRREDLSLRHEVPTHVGAGRGATARGPRNRRY